MPVGGVQEPRSFPRDRSPCGADARAFAMRVVCASHIAAMGDDRDFSTTNSCRSLAQSRNERGQNFRRAQKNSNAKLKCRAEGAEKPINSG
jgi:hypothetical protein